MVSQELPLNLTMQDLDRQLNLIIPGRESIQKQRQIETRLKTEPTEEEIANTPFSQLGLLASRVQRI